MIVEFRKDGELQRGFNFRYMVQDSIEFARHLRGMEEYVASLLVDNDLPIKSVELSFGENGTIKDLNSFTTGARTIGQMGNVKQVIHLR